MLGAVTTVLFDLDDTLIDHHHAAEEGVRQLAHSVGMTHQLAAILERWREAPVHYNRFLLGELTYEEMAITRVRHALRADLPADAARALFDVYQNGYQGAWRVFNDVLPCLEALSAFRLGIITNGRALEQHAKLQHLGLTSYFQQVRTTEGTGLCKPAPEIFQETCAQLGIPAVHAVYIGDHLRNDYEGARAAGLQALWLNRQVTSDVRREGEIRSLQEVAGLLACA